MSVNLDLDIQGQEQAIARLQKLLELEDRMAVILGEWGKEVLDGDLYGTQNYAPPPPNSTHVRTGRLGANWGLRRAGPTAIAFTNPTAYAGWVVGDDDGTGQAAIHAGRWWIALRKIEDRVDLFVERVEDWVLKIGT